jgi:putative ABC transport system ATP-binding protein
MNNTPDGAIRADDVVKVFDDGAVRALNGVTLRVEPGEFVAITGRSGCGKSTLLHLLAALDTPTSGTIHVNGHDLRAHPDLDRYRRREIGLVFQLHNLLPHLTALQNVEIAMFSNGSGHPEQRRKAEELLNDVGLPAKIGVKPPRLSGGERQRLAVARALANDPAILLADEPTGSLDTAAVGNLLALFSRIREAHRLTILLVTHDLSVAGTADRIVHMVDGRTVDGPPV